MTPFARVRAFASRLSLPAVAALGVAVAMPVQAQDFYRGKQVNIHVSSDPGGGYDTYTRTLARHLDRHIPGNPQIVVLNMPGGGGLRAAQFTYFAAPKDGTVIGDIRSSNMLEAILGIRGTDMDPTKFEWLGSLSSDTDVCSFSPAAGVKTFADMQQKELLVGASGKGSQSYMIPNAINRMLGTKMKIILGYKGAADRVLAVERGELQGNCGINGSTMTANYGQQMAEGKLIPVVQSGLRPYSALPNVPLTQSFAKTEEQREVLEALFSQLEIARTYAFPPGTPAARVAEMRRAFAAVVKDPQFLADAQRTKIDISPLSGEDTHKLIVRLANMRSDIKARVKELIEE